MNTEIPSNDSNEVGFQLISAFLIVAELAMRVVSKMVFSYVFALAI